MYAGLGVYRLFSKSKILTGSVHFSSQLLYLIMGVFECGLRGLVKRKCFLPMQAPQLFVPNEEKGSGSVAATRPAAHSLWFFYVLEKALQMSLSAVGPCFVLSVASRDNRGGPVCPLKRDRSPVKFNFWQERSTVRRKRREAIHYHWYVATVIFCFQATRPALRFGVEVEQILTMCLPKASMEGLICSSVEKKPCEAVNG